jgi:hypothetical protein
LNSDPEKVRQLVLPRWLAGTALAGWLAGWLCQRAGRACMVLRPSAAHDAPKNRAREQGGAGRVTERAREQGGTFGLSLPLFCKS